MSTQLAEMGVQVHEGYKASHIAEHTDLVVVGNTIARGNPELEAVLDSGLRYCSGAQWLGEHALTGKWVLAVAGTHGKTTTSSLLAWLLEDNDLNPGFMIGGVPENFGISARLGTTPFFVIEADEYDTAFCDKRSKFVHYQPRTLVLNNLEFDHADIFKNLAAIQTQFHHLLKIVPSNGVVIHNTEAVNIDTVLEMGCWASLQGFMGVESQWTTTKIKDNASKFTLKHEGTSYTVISPLIGDHNMANAVAAIAAAHHAGIPIANAIDSLQRFKSVKRRMETIYEDENVQIMDDFAHHPTAISETLNGLRNSVGNSRIIAVLEPRSNTMKRGVHKHLLRESLSAADQSLIYASKEVLWNIDDIADQTLSTFNDTQQLLDELLTIIKDDSNESKTHVLIMSNGGFEDIYQRIIRALKQ